MIKLAQKSNEFKLTKKGDRSSREDAHRLLGGKMKNKVNIGDTVFFVVEHYYYIKDKAGARMEYLPVEGTVKDFIVGGYRQAVVRSIIDRVVHLHYFKTADYGRRFYFSYDDALSAAIRAADGYDHAWGEITHEKIRRPWEVEKQ